MNRTIIVAFGLFSFCLSANAQDFEFLERKDAFAFVPAGSKKPDKSILYFDAGHFADGFCEVSNGKFWGAVDVDGAVAIPLQYEDLRNLGKGRFLVKEKGNYGVIDKNGELVIPLLYQEAELFGLPMKEGYAYRQLPRIKLDGDMYKYDIFADSFYLHQRTAGEVFKVTPEMPRYFEECETKNGGDRRSVHNCNTNAISKWIREEMDAIGAGDVSVIMQFIVTDSLEIKDVEIVRTDDYRFNPQIIEIMKYAPVYAPGRNRGRNVNTHVTVLVK